MLCYNYRVKHFLHNTLIINRVINTMIKYILFDFDGTLIDTNDLIIYCLRQTYKEFLNKELSRDDLNAILGKVLVEQFKHLSETRYEDMVSYYRELYRRKHDEMVAEFPGAGNAVEKLKKMGCKIAIVSSKGRSGIDRGLKHFSMEKYIDAVVSANDVQNSKPHPEPALMALEALEGVKKNALLIGDSPYDIQCGKNAGVKTALVDWTIFPKDDVLSHHPDFYIKSFEELLEIADRY